MGKLNLFLIRDIKNLLKERKSIIVLIFLNIIILAISAAFSLAAINNYESFSNLFTGISKTKTNIYDFCSRIIILYSLLIYTLFPFILGTVIISYLKEFGELELMMFFPIDRKKFFLEKVTSIFLVSVVLAWINFLLCILIQGIIFQGDFSIGWNDFFYTFVLIPIWLFFISCVTVLISAVSKDSKEANQRSMILPFILLAGVQLAIILKVNIFARFFLLIPFVIAVAGIFIITILWKKKFNLEKILYK